LASDFLRDSGEAGVGAPLVFKRAVGLHIDFVALALKVAFEPRAGHQLEGFFLLLDLGQGFETGCEFFYPAYSSSWIR